MEYFGNRNVKRFGRGNGKATGTEPQPYSAF